MTFPLPPAEAAFVAELVRQLDGRFVEDEPAPVVQPSLFQIPARAQQEIDEAA